MALEPFVCPKCKQSADQLPGFKRNRWPEAVGVQGTGMIAVDSLECKNCGYAFVVPKGSVEIRKPPKTKKLKKLKKPGRAKK